MSETRDSLNGESQNEVVAPDSADQGDAAQREAREKLAAMSAAMAERSKQPLLSGDASATAPPAFDLERAANQSNSDAAKFIYPAEPLDEVPVVRSAEPPKSKPTVVAKSAKAPTAISTRWLIGTGFVAAISGSICFVLGTQYSPERIVVSSLPPAKDQHFGNGAPIEARGDNRIADIAAASMPTVVSICLAPPLPSKTGSGTPFKLLSRGFNEDAWRAKHVLGTGLIIRSDGYIITSAHVLRMKERTNVVLNDKRAFDTRLVGKDSFTDLAVLKIDAHDLPVARFASKDDVRQGDWAIAIGSPYGFDHSVSLGIVSAIGRSIAELNNNHVRLIQTDAAMNPGNSGGPLLNIRGEVIGITAAIKNGAQGIGFAVPVAVVRQIANEIMAYGTVPRPYLGIFMDDMTPTLAQQFAVSDAPGVLITSMAASSPCQKAGLGQGDIITKVDGHPVTTASEVRSLLELHKPGDELEFVVLRKSGEEKRKIIVGNYPDSY